MKKILIILVLILSPMFVKAEKIEVKIEPIENVYWNFYRAGVLYSGEFSYIYVGSELGYSINVTKEIVDETYFTTTEMVNNSRVMPYAYFGYGYDDHDSKEYYMATQKIIWRLVDSVEVYFTTGPNSTGSIIDIKAYEDEVDNIYNNYMNFPDYGRNLIFNIGSKNVISKKNLISKDLNIINETKNNITIDENDNLLIDANEVGSAFFYLESKYPKNGENIVYETHGKKRVIVARNVESKSKKYTYEVIGGSININVKFDKIIEEKITNNRFELYNSNDKLIGIYSPNEDGNITISNLEIDKYKLKHIDITEGYNKENNEYLFEIVGQNLNINKEIILNLKTTRVSINKTYGNIILNDVNYSSNVIYEIYNEKGNYINEFKTNEKGYAEFNLDYGNYKIIEPSLKRNMEYIEINKSMFDSDNHFDIHTYEYNTNLKVLTLNKDTNEKISNVNFGFNDNSYTTNEEGICIIEDVIFNKYKISEININGFKKIDSFIYEINDNSEFYIENNKPYTELRIYLDKEFIEDNKEQNNIITEDNINKKEENIIVEVETKEEIEEIIMPELDMPIIEENIEKLPFLGDNKVNEESKFINYIYNFIKFNWL